MLNVPRKDSKDKDKVPELQQEEKLGFERLIVRQQKNTLLVHK